MTKVDLSNNNIGDAGCASLCDALKVNAIVRVVNLDGNNISDENSARADIAATCELNKHKQSHKPGTDVSDGVGNNY